MNHTAFYKKVRITGVLVFETAFRIGSGREGDLAVDLGVLKDEQNWPVLPGSTLKGNFRATAERLACYLGFSTCLLDYSLSKVKCVSEQEFFQNKKDEFKALKDEKKKMEWINKNACDICRLFGSSVEASRIFFSDGKLIKWGGGFQIRDGVVIDRDSETARHGLKFDFEVTPKDSIFEILIDMDNPKTEELALVGAVIAEWEAGFRIGGFTSRGLGEACLTNTHVTEVDYHNPNHLKDYLLKRKMQDANSLLSDALTEVLEKEIKKGGD